MDKYSYSGESSFRPLSPWAYFGYSILFVIPVIGWIFLIVLSFNGENINRRNFARSFWCLLIVLAIVYTILLFSGIQLLSSVQSLSNFPSY